MTESLCIRSKGDNYILHLEKGKKWSLFIIQNIKNCTVPNFLFCVNTEIQH